MTHSLDRVIEGGVLLSKVPVVIDVENGEVSFAGGIEFYVYRWRQGVL